MVATHKIEIFGPSAKMYPPNLNYICINTTLMNRLTPFLLLIFFSCSKEDSEVTPTETIKYTVSVTAGEGGTVNKIGGEYKKGSSINKSFNDLAKASYQLQKDIDAHVKKSKEDGTFK